MTDAIAIELPSRTFHALSAGSTTIMPTGKVIRFGGRVEKVEGGTQVGRGTYITANEEEIAWLVSLCKQPSPQIWEEKEDPVAIPKNVENGAMAETAKVTEDIQDNAARATNPKLVAMQEKLGSMMREDGGAIGVMGNSQNMAALAGSSNVT